MPHQSGKPDWTGGNPGLNPGKGGGSGKPDGSGSKKGELYGDQWVLYRDFDPTDGGGNGEPVMDLYNTEGQIIAVGYDPLGLERPLDADHLFPIYFEEGAEGDYEIPANLLPYVQEVELERANVARAPAKVTEKALDAALTKIFEADDIQTDPAGRIMYSNDGGVSYTTIDAPLENLAVYQYLMVTEGGTAGAWPDITDTWDEVFQGLLGDDLQDPDWDPSSLLAAAWSKTGEITVDAMLYENTTLGVNVVSGSGETLQVDYFDFSDPAGELYHYDRAATYSDTWLRYEIVVDGDPTYAYGTVYDAVFGETPWVDEIPNIVTGADPSDDDFEFINGDLSGVNDFAQAADDARAVIEFMHEFDGVEIDEGDIPESYMETIA